MYHTIYVSDVDSKHMWHGGLNARFAFTIYKNHESTDELSGMFIQIYVYFISLFVIVLGMFSEWKVYSFATDKDPHSDIQNYEMLIVLQTEYKYLTQGGSVYSKAEYCGVCE